MTYEAVKDLMIRGDMKTRFLSSPTQIMQSSPEHGRVLMLGSAAIPYLIKLLKTNTGNIHAIFMMLRTLSHVQPDIPKEKSGRVLEIRQLWLDLAEEHEYFRREHDQSQSESA